MGSNWNSNQRIKPPIDKGSISVVTYISTHYCYLKLLFCKHVCFQKRPWFLFTLLYERQIFLTGTSNNKHKYVSMIFCWMQHKFGVV